VQIILNTQTDSKIYALDTDYRAPQSLEHIDIWEKCVDLRQPQEWDELQEDTDYILKTGGKDDWLVIDQADQPWGYVQAYYIEQIMGKKPHQFFFDFKKGGGRGNPMAGAYGENWNIINQMYRDWMVRQVLRFKGHVLAVAKSEPIGEGDEALARKYFGPYGVKPRGQKDLGYQFDSILLTKFGRTGNDYQLTTVGDTNRAKLDEQPLNDFAVEYLVKIAGWKIV